ncbi:MAG: hypothetical protein JW983_09945 [Elusimicrobia bacterium]|nr:hypothetical protein [Elusimicrobiota bacterium]
MKPKKDQAKSFLIKTDINFEKWSIFTTRKQNSERTLKRTNDTGLTQTIHISPLVNNGKQYTLTASECKLMYVLDKLWQNADCTIDKPVFFNFKQLADELGLKWSGKTLKHIKRCLMNLRGVMITFENCYKTSKKDEVMKTTEMMTVLSHIKIFERYKRNAGEPYFAFSEFQFHPYILQSLHNNFVKPVRLDVIRQLKSDIAVILYRWLDLMLFKHNIIERELRNLAKELGLDHIRNNNFLNQVKHATSELMGKELVSGVIGNCEVIRLNNDRGWKLIVKKTRGCNGKHQVELEQDKKEFQEWKIKLGLLSTEEKEKLREEAINNQRTNGQMITDLGTLIEMINIFKKQEILQTKSLRFNMSKQEG